MVWPCCSWRRRQCCAGHCRTCWARRRFWRFTWRGSEPRRSAGWGRDCWQRWPPGCASTCCSIPPRTLADFSDPTTIGRLAVLLAGGLTVSLVADRMRRGRIRERESEATASNGGRESDGRPDRRRSRRAALSVEPDRSGDARIREPRRSPAPAARVRRDLRALDAGRDGGARGAMAAGPRLARGRPARLGGSCPPGRRRLGADLQLRRLARSR